MTRGGLFLTALLAAASVGVFAQDSRQSASAPSQVGNQAVAVQNSTPQSGGAQTSAPASVTQVSSQQPASASHPVRAAAANTDGVANDPAGTPDDGVPPQQLPQTSTILPLLGLIGLGSLVAGLFARR